MQTPGLTDRPGYRVYSRNANSGTLPFPLREAHPGLKRCVRPPDELANFITHGIGFLLSLLGAAVLVRMSILSQDPWMVAGCTIYSASLVSLYLASTLSHAFFDIRWRYFYRRLDQMCIFLLISGSYTPFGLTYLRHGWWPLLTAAMWILAITGAGTIWHQGYLSARAQTLYLLMGWLPAISLISIVKMAPQPLVTWLVIGGILYTMGTIFLWLDHKVKYFHALWHIFVVAGSTCQYVAILLLVSVS